MALHKKIVSILNITIGLDNKEIKTFGVWNEFINTDWNISPKTKYITLEWDFSIVLPGQQGNIPQTHTLRVKIGNSLKPNEIIQVVFQGDEEYDLEELQSEMVCKIDFVNYEICNELKSAVVEWYDALPERGEGQKLIPLIIRYRTAINAFIVTSFLTAGVIFLNYLFNFFQSRGFKFNLPGSDQKMFLFITVTIPIMYIFYRLGDMFADRNHRKVINELRRDPMFKVTKGDENKLKEIKISNKNLLWRLIKNIIYSLGTNLIMYLIGLVLNYF